MLPFALAHACGSFSGAVRHPISEPLLFVRFGLPYGLNAVRSICRMRFSPFLRSWLRCNPPHCDHDSVVLPVQNDTSDAPKIWRIVLKSRVRKCRPNSFERRSEAGGLITDVSVRTQNAA